MRYAPGHKERTRSRILDAAGRVFRRRGYQGAGVDEVMQEAGLTSGGFYSHFESKEALLKEALTHAAAEMELQNRGKLAGRSGREWRTAFIDFYLSPSHRGDVEGGCPLVALISEVARSGESVKQSFETILCELAKKLGVNPGDDRGLAILALCVGGLSLSRSVRDEALAERILAACRDSAREMEA